MKNKLDRQYQMLLQTILDHGIDKEDRTGTGTRSIFGYTIRHNMADGFPLLTTKKMFFKGIVTELQWFLQGRSDLRFLLERDCNIWNGDAYKNYLKHTITGVENGLDRIKGHLDNCLVEFEGSYEHFTNPSFAYGFRPHTQEEFINKIKTDDEFAKKWGELGPIYGSQWRDWGSEVEFGQGESVLYGGVDQIANLINDLKTNPDSRRLMVNAWNVGELDQMVLPPCHYGFQVYTRELSLNERRVLVSQEMFNQIYNGGGPETLSHSEINQWNIPTRAISLMWNQRSVDTFLGLPFNIASYGLLLEIIAKTVNMVPDELIGNLGDTHLYLNHIEQAKEQIGRKYQPEERSDLLKTAMGEEQYNQAVSELMPFGGGMSEYYEYYEIPTRTREPFDLPKLAIQKTDAFWKDFDISQVSHLDPADFVIENYKSHPTIKAPLSN
jgi:thymidylate synthase